MKEIAKTNQDIQKFAELVSAGIESFVEAGKIVSRNLDADPEFADKIHAAHPSISVDMVYSFDRIGRGELHPKMLVSNQPGIKKLRRLPFRYQEKYADEPVPLLIKNGNSWETLQVSVYNLTPEQARQVFDADGVRTEAAQRAWIEAAKAKAAPISIDEAFRVVGRTLVVMEPCKLTARQLAGLLAQME